MKTRAHDPEMLDRPDLPHSERVSTYRFLEIVNKIGGARAIGKELARLSRSWRGPIRILDVGSGGADIPRAIARWAARAGHDVSIVCLDNTPDAIAWARERSRAFPRIRFVRGDARAIPFPPGSFDYVICSLFLHHLGDEEVVGALAAFDRLATRGLVLCDLIRSRIGWLSAKLVTLLGAPVVRFDGPLSVRRSFTLDEIRGLARRAGLPWVRARRVLGHHFVLSGERPGFLQSPP
jgi:ubiquinone/menaquinone biosynthesis C-methylase UbiE